MKAYKGFNKDLTCRGFQYEVGKEYQEDSADLCNSGFHACENPLDCFGYYAPGASVYHEVELDDVSDQKDSDTKRVGKRIKIGAEISLKGIVDAAVKFIFERVDWVNAKATNTGDQSAATNTGYRSAATNTGNQSAATVEGKESVAIVTGYDSQAKGALGCWIVVAERGEWNGETYPIKCIKTAKVDGETIKPDTFYKVVDGKWRAV